MCQSSDDLKFQANWDGAEGESRQLLFSDLSRRFAQTPCYAMIGYSDAPGLGSISPSMMIPEHRMAELLTQVKEASVHNCPYHNTKQWPSLYTDHICDRDDFPLDTVCELDRHSDEVWFLSFSNDGTRLATASKDKLVVIYETQTFQILHVLSGHKGSVAYVAWSPDDSKLVTCTHGYMPKVSDGS